MRVPLFGQWALLWCVALLGSCIDPYVPEGVGAAPNYLVVDGYLNSRGSSTIKLSRTYRLEANAAPPQETGATLFIEQQAGPRFPLSETSPGTYTSQNLTLNAGSSYRLFISTQRGQQYASAFVTAQITPPIDSVTWRKSNTGITIAVNAHDDTGSSQYYRWECEETWEITPLLFPQLEYFNSDLRPNTVFYPRICWGNEQVTDIKLSKTTNLTQDIISNYALRSYSTTNERFYNRYSILVKQYALSRQEYQYWELLEKNTENIGTLFDPLPSQLTGNVRSLADEAEPVIGYVGCHSLQQQRIFIARNQLPNTWRISSGYDQCIPDTVESRYIRTVFSYPENIPLYYVPGGVLGTSKECVDCRRRGAAVKPDFWP